MSSPRRAIGGYLELELPPARVPLHAGALQYQSARAAFLALLQQMPEIRRVWVPYYLCDSMLAPVRATGKELTFYSIDERFAPSGPLPLGAYDLMLYVNYFGVCDGNVAEVLAQHDPDRVVIDCSQAFYSGPFACLATVYSPRKFFGVPDGGLLVTRRALVPPAVQDEDSVKRCAHLLHRLAFSAEEGYEAYRDAEASLGDQPPKGMSQLTERLLAAIDYHAVKQRRRENFVFLANALGSTNTLAPNAMAVAPLCYPYLPARKQSRDVLIQNRIFIPTYWPDVRAVAKAGSFEMTVTEDLLAVPCDQRYCDVDLEQVADLLTRGGECEH